VTDVLEVERFLDDAALERIRAEMRAAAGGAATLLGSTPDAAYTSSVRKATRLAISGATRDSVTEWLERERPRIADHFGRPLEECEEPQFLSYGPGDYFVAHQDGNTALVHDESRFRRVSVVLFLSDPATEFAGGALVLDPFGTRRELAPAPGTLVAYPSETTHEVAPITDGERLTIVSWYRGGE
jgi:SM-20-related protein